MHQTQAQSPNGHDQGAVLTPGLEPHPPAASLHSGAKLHQRRRPPVPLLILAAVIVLGLLGWIGSEWWASAQPAPPLTASGTLETDEVTIASEVPGRLSQLEIMEGQTVRAGQEVARLDNSVPQMQLQQSVSQADALQLAQLTAQKYVITAPRAGIITQVPVHQGEVVAAGQMLAGVSDLSTLKLTAWVLERDLGKVSVGQVVQVVADPFPGKRFGGLVTSINTQAEFTPRNVQTQTDRLNLVFGVN
ncbi:MAG TPA: efflux RND transporter periplasmic adaptor subunit, partial [Chloroflexota bacterium]